MAPPTEADLASDAEAAERGCETVRRYVTLALFGGDERVLRQTVTDPELVERAFLFWAAYSDRRLDDIEVLFANADGTRVACHLTATAIQDGAWIASSGAGGGDAVVLECTGTYVIAEDRIAAFRETWR